MNIAEGTTSPSVTPDPCQSSPCRFGGQCVSLPKVAIADVKPICTCVNDYTGPTCNLDNSVCKNNPCQNEGTCVPGDATPDGDRKLA